MKEFNVYEVEFGFGKDINIRVLKGNDIKEVVREYLELMDESEDKINEEIEKLNNKSEWLREYDESFIIIKS